MKSIISSHNSNLMKVANTTNNDPPCNCRSECILPGNCITPCVVYKATTTNADHKVNYEGSTACEFKVRYRNHKASFINENKRNETALSQFIWSRELNLNNNKEITNPGVKWEILKQFYKYRGGQNFCDLCINEKFYIIKNYYNAGNINHRSDLGNRCTHRNSHLLSKC